MMNAARKLWKHQRREKRADQSTNTPPDASWIRNNMQMKEWICTNQWSFEKKKKVNHDQASSAGGRYFIF
jgi:hypothetical protein